MGFSLRFNLKWSYMFHFVQSVLLWSRKCTGFESQTMPGKAVIVSPHSFSLQSYLRLWYSSASSGTRFSLFFYIETVQQLLTVPIPSLLFRFQALIILFFLRILNCRTASIKNRHFQVPSCSIQALSRYFSNNPN